MASVTVEEVDRGKGLERFTELPYALHGSEERFAPLVLSWERFRVSRWRNPYMREGTVALFLARRDGRPIGRVAAHLSPPPDGVRHPDRDPAAQTADDTEAQIQGVTEGRFGFWSCGDDPDVAEALVDAARTWLAAQGCSTMSGPWSFAADDEPGVLVAGQAVAGTTGRPWRPAFEAERLVDALGPTRHTEEEHTWRLPTIGGTDPSPDPSRDPTPDPLPGQAGRHLDPRLVLAGIAAVPDLSAALRTGGVRAALQAARRARRDGWEGCTVVRCTRDPVVAVPALLAAAGRAGYRWAVVPWSPDDQAEPETTHHRYHLDL